MKNISYLITIIVCNFPLVYGQSASQFGPPLEIRMSRLGDLLGKYAQLKVGEKMYAESLAKHGISYKLYWEKKSSSKEPVSCDQALKLAIALGKRDLPGGLMPEKLNLLSLGKYFISSKNNNWIWVAEFGVDDDSTMIGEGFPLTLFIPIGLSGQQLLTVRKVIGP